MKSLRIVFRFSNMEFSAVCKDLDDVAAFLDDASTMFCEDNDLKLYLPGAKKNVCFDWYNEFEGE